jgi:3-hydroxyisobutyrate dehydrogenase-like beta-hydroxyacid dehydrogenase
MTVKHVAFLGLGAMGLPMALNLQRNGFTVTGWNRSREKGEPLVAAGGHLAATPREAVAAADVVITMLADPAAVAQVAVGPEGFLAACRPGTIWVDCSTIGPTHAREMAARAAARTVTFVDAPVLGSVVPAVEGKLHFLVGGPAEAVERVMPLLEVMGSQVTHLGPTGQGAAAKIVSNMVTATVLAAAGEGLALAERLGLDRETMAEILAHGPVSSPILHLKLPLFLREEFSPYFRLRWMEKDLALALREASQAGAALPAAAAAHGEYAGARSAGMGDLDFAAVGQWIRKLAAGPHA